MLTKATADGTLYTRDWDIEPLFPFPNVDAVNKEYSLSLSLSLTKFCLAACISFFIFSFDLILILRIESYKEKFKIESTLANLYIFLCLSTLFLSQFQFLLQGSIIRSFPLISFP